MKSPILVVFLALACYALTGCGMSGPVPTSYTEPVTGAITQYSDTDENILKSCNVIEANLATIRAGAALSVGGVLQASIKTPATLANDGMLCYQISSGVYSMTATTQTKLPTGAQLGIIVGGFTSNVTDQEVTKDVGLITSALNNVYASYYAQLTAMAAKTDNALVQKTILKTGLDVLNALAGGVMDGTQQYAPTTTTQVAWIRWSDLKRLA